MYAIIIHGGAGKVKEKDPQEVEKGMKNAVEAGLKVLREGGRALDAVEAAVNVLEDDPLFNAGTGSVLTFDGEVEMDAAVAYGPNLDFGAVAGVKNIRHPISLAKKVMEKTDHVLLAGNGANDFAKLMGFEYHDPITQKRKEQWEKYRKQFINGDYKDWPKLRKLFQEHPEFLHGTVGAVAVDSHGECAAATSTGGVFLKLLGRVGDTPIPGAGTYATPFGAASSTGLGEGMMRVLITKVAADFLRMGLDAPHAAEAVLNYLDNTVGTEAGIIIVDRHGEVGMAHNTPDMPHAYFKEGMSEIKVAMR
ncbi:isoaspartyl peptidase/L-asparaginase family protein [Mesoaciditoga lauensis]|uniref:isoaspartyl peptidase/L-asparaginase family protein n=1 Tax=Mesoaciditoga lauensis TaxID=1495039 RepID=UPI00055CCB88|nr:isoaspartyl peptidase/L-asparaginase family protein [Mesoaciditoga lauensis]